MNPQGGASITIKGLDAVNAKLARLSGAQGKKAIRKGMRQALKPLQARIKDLLPQGATGTLRKAVKIQGGKARKGGVRLTVGFGAKTWKATRYYGSFRELGTSKMEGAHAFKAALGQLGEPTRDDAERRILAELDALISQA